MRRRKPLAALAAACLAAAIVLALTAFPAEPATAVSYVPMKVTPSCGAPGSQTGYSVHLNAANLSPGTNTLYIGEQGPNHDTTTNLGTLTIPDDGTLDQTVTLPAQSGNVPYELYVTSAPQPRRVRRLQRPVPDAERAADVRPCRRRERRPLRADDLRRELRAPTDGSRAPAPPTYPLGGAFFPVHIELDGTEVPGSPAKVNADGTFSVLVTPVRAKPGTHTFHAYQTNADGNGRPAIVTFRDVTTPFTVPCPTTPTTPTDAEHADAEHTDDGPDHRTDARRSRPPRPRRRRRRRRRRDHRRPPSRRPGHAGHRADLPRDERERARHACR